jgi:putative transcriptional regulator
LIGGLNALGHREWASLDHFQPEAWKDPRGTRGGNLTEATEQPLTYEELTAELRRAVFKAELRLEYKNDAARVKAIPTPKPMSQKDILRLRKKFKVSQKVFARLLNVSPKTVQAWEQGTRVPSDAALKLLSIAEHYPHILLDIVIDLLDIVIDTK